MRSYQKYLKLFGLRLEAEKIFYNDRYIKNKIRSYDDKVYTNFQDINVPEDDTE